MILKYFILLQIFTKCFSIACDSLANSCPVIVGVPLNNGEIFEISPSQRLFFNLAVDSSTPRHIDIEASILYGNIQIYAAFDRKPKIASNDFEYSNRDASSSQDLLEVDLDAYGTSSGRTLHVMVVALDSTKLAALVSAHSVTTTLVLGLPYHDDITIHSISTSDQYAGQVLYEYTPTSTDVFSVLLTPYSSTSSNTMDVSITGPRVGHQPGRSWSSGDISDTLRSNSRTNAVNVVPNADEMNKPFSIVVHLQAPRVDNNSTVGTGTSSTADRSASYVFSIVVSQSTSILSPTILLGGYAQEDASTSGSLVDISVAVQGESTHFYALYVPPGREDVLVSLDSQLGDADIYVNPSVVGGSPAAFGVNQTCFYEPADLTSPLAVWYSHSDVGTDSVVVPATSAQSITTGGYYCITVYAHGFSRYSLRGSTSSTLITMNEGTPVHDYITAGTYHYYRFRDSQVVTWTALGLPVYRNIEIDLNSLLGDADLFVGCDIVPTGDDSGFPSRKSGHHNHSAASTSEDTMSFSPAPTDGRSCLAQRNSSEYYIAVYGYKDSYVQLSIMHSHGIMSLTEGVPLNHKIVYKHGEQFYRIRIGFEAEKILVATSPYNGDVDLYVSYDIDTLSQFNYDYASTVFGSGQDSVIIPETDVKCSDCWLYVMVYGYASSEYSILYTLDDTTVLLTSGVPLLGSVAENDIEYYLVYLPTISSTTSLASNYSVTAVITVFSGAPKLFMTLGSDSSSANIVYPNSTTPNTLVFDEDDVGSLPVLTMNVNVSPQGTSSSNTNFNAVYIGVGGDNKNSTYSVRAHITDLSSFVSKSGEIEKEQPVLLHLLDGIPQNDAIRYSRSGTSMSMWRYYQIPVFPGHESIDVRVTTIIGEVDAYVTRCPYQTYDCAGTHAIEMSKATGSDKNLIPEPSYLPNATSYTLTTHGLNNYDHLSIDRNDNTSCSYIVGIQSTNYYSEYQISFSMDNTILALQAGVSITDHIEKGEYDYFSFEFAGFSDDDSDTALLQFTLTPLYGDADLFISTDTVHPDKDSNKSYWSSTLWGADTITIDPYASATSSSTSEITITHHECVGCTYYISVYGSSVSSYSLTVSVHQEHHNTIFHLSNGIPSTGYVLASSWNQYLYHHTTQSSSDATDIRVSLSSWVGDADLYVNIAPDTTSSQSNDAYAFPTVMEYDYTSGDSGMGDDSVTISHLDDKYDRICKQTGSCVILVGVFGFEASEYRVTLTTSLASTLLLLDVPQSGAVASDSHDLYRVLINNHFNASDGMKTGVRLSLTQYSGHVALYAMCKTLSGGRDSFSATAVTLLPNSTNALWSLSPNDGSSVDIYYVDAVDKGCLHGTVADAAGGAEELELFFAVYAEPRKASDLGGVPSSATYNVMASLIGSNDADSLPLLIEGVAVSATLASNEMKYYTIQLNRDDLSNDVTVKFTVTTGSVAAYASNSWDTRPIYQKSSNTVSSFLYSSQSASTIGSTSQSMKFTHHDLQNVVCGGNVNHACYLIIGVLNTYASGNSMTVGLESRCTIVMSFEDTTVMLQSGVPVTSNVGEKTYEYYRYAVTIPQVDVELTLTPLSGDPDLFVTLSPPGTKHPSRFNFTWLSSTIDTDALTIQYDDLARNGCDLHLQAGVCDLYIGIYGWHNSSYTLVANVNEGFKSPITLLDGQPQSGVVGKDEYVYYKYQVSSIGDYDIVSSIKITVTPSDSSGDQDIYAVMSDRTVEGTDDIIGADLGTSNINPAYEPGLKNYDFKSTSYGGIADEIVISPDDNLYCTNCMIYIAVYGYSPGPYTIGASASGLTGNLQYGVTVGGHVNEKGYNYYILHNSDPMGVIVLSLTTIYGDADLYVNAYKRNGHNQVHFPRSGENVDWRSMRTGDDSIVIRYSDRHFCSDCDYVVGVFAYRNATYTLLVTEAEDSIVTLIINRPQIASISWSGSDSSPTKNLRYFMVSVDNDMEDMTVSLTSLDTGSADMFLQCYNSPKVTESSSLANSTASGIVLPDPKDSSTYLSTTVGSTDDILTVSHVVTSRLGEDVKCIIAVKAYTSDLRFSIVASISLQQSAIAGGASPAPIILQPGIPQDHFVGKGYTELFAYFPSDESEDVHITVTGRSGDPDIIAGVQANRGDPYVFPRCNFSSENQWIRQCEGSITWSSSMYSTDQIIISHDFPCRSVVDTTQVNVEQCRKNPAYGTNNPIIIGVFGFTAAKFTVMVVPTGQQVTLLPGRPQISSTTSGYICSTRDIHTGACILTKSNIARPMQVSYFSFQVNPTNAAKSIVSDDDSVIYGATTGDSAVIFTVVEYCNMSSSPSTKSNGHPLLPSEVDDSTDDYSKALMDRDCINNPLKIVVNSCPKSKCNVYHMFPSELVNQHKAQMQLRSGSSADAVGSDTGTNEGVSEGTLFLMYDPLMRNNDDFRSGTSGGGGETGYCDPDLAGEPCMYYIAVDAPVIGEGSVSGDDDHDREVHSDNYIMGREFTITARTPGDITLVRCDDDMTNSNNYGKGNKEYMLSDGLRVSTVETIPFPVRSPPSSGSHRAPKEPRKYFEVCVNSNLHQDLVPRSSHGVSTASSYYDGFMITLEQCVGETSLFACSDDAADQQCHALLPTPLSWSYFADKEQSCVQRTATVGASHPVEACQERVPGAASGLKVPFTRTTSPTLQLPLSTSSHPSLPSASIANINSYYVMAQGAGEFVMHMQYTNKGKVLNPVLVLSDPNVDSPVIPGRVTENAISLKWTGAQVSVPYVQQLKSFHASDMYYMIYIVDRTGLNKELQENQVGGHTLAADTYLTDTMCGLEYMAQSALSEKYTKKVRVMQPPIPPSHRTSVTIEHTIPGLLDSNEYDIIVTAHCDSNCLGQVAKTSIARNDFGLSGNDDPLVCSSSSVLCKPQSLLYAGVSVTTKSSSVFGSDTEGSFAHSVQMVTTATIVMIVVALVVLLIAAYFYRKSRLEDRTKQYEVVNVHDSAEFDDSQSQVQNPMQQQQRVSTGTKRGTNVVFKNSKKSNRNTYVPPLASVVSSALGKSKPEFTYSPLAAPTGDSDGIDV